MGRTGRIVALALLLVTALVVVGCWQDESGAESTASTATDGNGGDELTVAIAGMVIPEEGLAYYQDLARYVGRKVGMPVRLFHKAEYAEVNEMLAQGKIDMAFVCSGPYVTGRDDFGLELLAAPVIQGQPVYYSYIIVAKDSPISSLEGLRGKTFAYTDPQSNTGKAVPDYLVVKMGESPENFFGRTYLTYSHDNSIKAVATGEADGAGVDSLIWDYANATDPTYTAKTRIILKSDPFGIPPVVVRPGMDRVLKQRLQDALISAKDDPEGKAILKTMMVEEFVVVDDSHYDSIRDMNEWVSENK